VSSQGAGMDGGLMRPKEAARWLAVSLRKLAQLVQRRELPSVPLGRCRRFEPKALREFVERLKGGGDGQQV